MDSRHAPTHSVDLPLRVFFDVDGVLIHGWHSKPNRRRAWDTTLTGDLGVDRDAFRRAFFDRSSTDSASWMEACTRGDQDLRHALTEVLPTVGYQGPVDAFIRYWFEKDSTLNKRLLDLIRQLKECANVELYVLTAQEHLRADYLWNELRLRDYFLGMFYTAKLRHLKTEPGFFGKVNALVGASPGERPILFDDDMAVVTAARAAGWDAHAFDTVDDIYACPRVAACLAGTGCVESS